MLGGGTPHQILGFDAVQSVLRDGETFTSSGYADTIGHVFGHSILEMDEPEHHAYRALIQQAFTRKAMETWEADIVRPVVDELVGAFADRGHADLVGELMFPFPVKVIAGMIGLPAEDLPQFHAKAVELITIATAIERGLDASVWLYDYFLAVITDRRANPRHDLISVLVEAELDGQRLSDDEIIAFLRLAAPGRGRDHVPVGEQLDVRSAQQPRPAGRAARRSLVDAAGDRGRACGGSRRSPASVAPRRATSRSRAC